MDIQEQTAVERDTYAIYEADTFANAPNLPRDFICDLQEMERDNPKKYRRYVLNSHEEIEIEGAYYGSTIEKLMRIGRIGEFPYAPNSPVHIVMDPGYHIALWFFQIRGLDPVFLRCWELLGGGVEGIKDLMDEYESKYGYYYGQFFAPIDVDNNAHRTTHGDTLLEAFRPYGIHIEPLDYEFRVNDGITRTKKFLADCRFDAEGCEIGIEALQRYRASKNQTMSSEEKPVFDDHPSKGWEVHLSDAFRYASLAAPLVDDNSAESNSEILRLIAAHG